MQTKTVSLHCCTHVTIFIWVPGPQTCISILCFSSFSYGYRYQSATLLHKTLSPQQARFSFFMYHVLYIPVSQHNLSSRAVLETEIKKQNKG
jgi:hypothetical protein